MTSPRILVVSACSKRKRADHELPLFGGTPDLPARDRYAGRAHLRVRDAIDRWRQARPSDLVAWSIVSAGFGLVDEHGGVPDYDATFAGMSPAAATDRGRELGIPEALLSRLPNFDSALLVLPVTYLNAAGAPFDVSAHLVYFAAPRFREVAGDATVVPCGIEDAKLLGVAPREIAAVRFEQFVARILDQGIEIPVQGDRRGLEAVV
jgi:hypothetical protein